MKKYLLACIVTSIITSLIFQIIGFFVIGYFDPFFLFALIGGALVSFIIAVIVGIPFAHGRNAGKEGRP
jgi:hypothetical protein